MPDMDFARMLEDLAEEYPEMKDKALDLKDDLSEIMPMEEELPLPEPELSLEEDEDELELEL